MRRIRFGRTNVEVPAVSLGTWGHGGPNVAEGASVGWSGSDDAAVREALVAAWRNGITHWDTADAYGSGHAEQLIGSVWDEVPRHEIFLATKFGYVKGPSGQPYDPAFMRTQCEASLRNLRTDVLDVHYFHHCDFGPADVYFDDALATMRRFQEEGKVRFIGLSDWDARRILRFIDRVDPDVVQPFRNLVDDVYKSSGLESYVDAHDLGVAFFSPLKHGLLLGKYEHAPRFPEGDFRRDIPEFSDEAFVQRMRRAAAAVRERFADCPEPVLHAVVGALLTGNPTSTVLLGQRTPAQVEAAARIGDALSEEEMEWVRAQYVSRVSS
ncbi:MAG TPA: aldo/keto reductase [Thermoanaerobaculia bacterium]|jgi:aryl-alcohol dehydrogenase-like predicted oxidoreductase|nr:aldo/keto reductase [Thermoanaerobaculia bacterium]